MEAGCKRSLTSICTAWPLRLFQLRVEIQWWVYWVWAGRPRSQGSIPDSKTVIFLLCKVPPSSNGTTSRILKLGIRVVALGLRRQSVTAHHRLLMRGTISHISHNFITSAKISFCKWRFCLSSCVLKAFRHRCSHRLYSPVSVVTAHCCGANCERVPDGCVSGVFSRNSDTDTYVTVYPVISRSQWPRGVGLRQFACWCCGFESHRRHGHLSAVIVVCCQVEVSATSWSLVQRSPADWVASLCGIWKPLEWGHCSHRWATAPQGEKKIPYS